VTPPRYRIVAIHGFLGSPADWAPLQPALPDAAWDCVDAWELFSSPRVSDWASAGAALDARLRASVADEPLPSFLVAYSFGARLSLAVPGLGLAGSPLAGACLVSCNPGLADSDDGARAARRESDERWAERFVDAPVGRIWKEWDAQPVFAGTSVPARTDRLPAPRVALARAMRVGSLGLQPDCRPILRAWRQPLLWVTGERDVKFRAISRELEEQGVPARFLVCDRAGHRVAWDNPTVFARALGEWIDGVLAGRATRS
jgi:2-succinyl-6-hydroxy-2,4-cyclohexadiene-1-carboxylate synthase